MSVFGGQIDFTSTNTKDFVIKKNVLRTKSFKSQLNEYSDIIFNWDDILTMKAKDVNRSWKNPKYFYQDTIEKLKNDNPKLGELYFKQSLDVLPIELKNNSAKKTFYQSEYFRDTICERDTKKKLFCEKLEDDVKLPLTTQQSSYRPPSKLTIKGLDITRSMKPIPDDSLKKQLETIFETKTGETTYSMGHSLLGRAVLENKPYGEPKESPLCSRWQGPPGYYRYLIR